MCGFIPDRFFSVACGMQETLAHCRELAVHVNQWYLEACALEGAYGGKNLPHVHDTRSRLVKHLRLELPATCLLSLKIPAI